MSRPHSELGFHRVAVMEQAPQKPTHELIEALLYLHEKGWRLVDGGMRLGRRGWINNWDILATVEQYRAAERGEKVPF